MPNKSRRPVEALIPGSEVTESIDYLSTDMADFILSLEDGHPMKDVALEHLDVLIEGEAIANNYKEIILEAGLNIKEVTEGDYEPTGLSKAIVKHPIKVARFFGRFKKFEKIYDKSYGDETVSTIALRGMSRILEDVRRNRIAEGIEQDTDRLLARHGDGVDYDKRCSTLFSYPFIESERGMELRSMLGLLASKTIEYEA